MKRKAISRSRAASAMIFGVGSFAHSVAQILKDDGTSVSTYLTRNYGHYPPALAGDVFTRESFPNPCPLVKGEKVGVVLPMSIDWAQAPWAGELIRSKVPIFSPTGEAMMIERDRDFARRLCAEFAVPCPKATVARNRLEAEAFLRRHPRPYVIKNPLCSPTSPIHTILCETLEDTRSWVRNIDYAEGVFLQEYMGRAEAGHIALISGGEIHSLVTNQEYKRAFVGDMGVVAGAPLGGLVERDPEDKYGLARQLIRPLLPWFRKVKYHGPIQATAVCRDGEWYPIEYNIRIGVTSGPMILRMLEHPTEVILRTARNQKLNVEFRDGLLFGCCLTLAGYGYPYVQVHGPQLPVEVIEPFDCDVWWNEVASDNNGQLRTTGHRIADVIALGASREAAIDKAYTNIRKIRSLASYYRTDIGQSLWPPGNI